MICGGKIWPRDNEYPLNLRDRQCPEWWKVGAQDFWTKNGLLEAKIGIYVTRICCYLNLYPL